MRQEGLGPGILAAQVDVAPLGADGQRRDRHRLDELVRVVLDQGAILEGAGLGFVRVADQVVRAGCLGAHGIPLDRRREGGAAAAGEAGLPDSLDHGLGADLACDRERLEPAVRDVVVEGHRVDAAGPPQQHERLVAGLGHRLHRRRLGGDRAPHLDAGVDRERRRPALTHAETGRLVCACRHGVGGRTVGATGEIGADVHLVGGPLVGGEQGVEAGHAVHLGRAEVETLGDVVHRGLAQPADPVVHRVQGGEQQMTSGAVGVTPDRLVQVPFRLGTEHRGHGCPFVGTGLEAACGHFHVDLMRARRPSRPGRRRP